MPDQLHDLEILLRAWRNYLTSNPPPSGDRLVFPGFEHGVQACADQLESVLAVIRAGVYDG